MGNLPQIGQPEILPLRVSIPIDLMDHQFQGQPVLPAVEAMEILARVLNKVHPHVGVDHMVDICFDKFLPLDPSSSQLDALVELCRLEDHAWQLRLMTRFKSPKATITRTKVHARLNIRRSAVAPRLWPMDVAAALEGICLSVEPETIYKELVPFGPAFQNIVAPVHVSPDGAMAKIKTPDKNNSSKDKPYLGSPYALDAVMHAACVWAQHFSGIVAFPVAIEARTIVNPVLDDRIYYGRVKPRKVSPENLIFDLAILDEEGGLCELVHGVHMRDVSGGRLKPPKWIIRADAPDPLLRLRKMNVDLTVIEADAVMPFAACVLSPNEKKRFEKQDARRQKSFLAGRLALKRLYRQCHGDEWIPAAHVIETAQISSPLPCWPKTDTATDAGLYCSLSHNQRFAVAVAGSNPVGVDVEGISDKGIESGHIYMDTDEQQLVCESDLGPSDAAMRVWTVKEAAAKTFSLNLAEAWQQVRITLIGRESSRFQMNDITLEAVHVQVDEHLVSLVTRP